jgi:hypothetical protein
MKHFLATLTIALATVLPALSTTAYAQGNSCFWADQVWNFQVMDNNTLRVELMGPDKYDLTVDFCWSLPFAQRIAFDGFGSSYICRGDHVFVFDSVFSSRPSDRCWIKSIKKVQ